jgi:hypothetical protein
LPIEKRLLYVGHDCLQGIYDDEVGAHAEIARWRVFISMASIASPASPSK